MRHTTSPSVAPDGTAIAYVVRDGGYPYIVQAQLNDDGVERERPVELPVEGPALRVLHSPDGKWVACEVSPKGSERLETFIVSTDPAVPGATPLRTTFDARTTLVEWDGAQLAMDAVAADGIAEARLVNPDTSRYTVMDRRLDSLLVAAEAGYCLMRVGPRGNRELLLVTPTGQWIPLLPPEPGATTEFGRILPVTGGELVVLVVTDHGADRQRIMRLVVDLDAHGTGGRPVCVEREELVSAPDADVDEFVISEDLSTAAVLWNQGGVSQLELLSLGEQQRVQVRRVVEVPGMVAAHLSITDDGSLLALTVEGPNLPPSVEVLRIAAGRVDPVDSARTERLEERSRLGQVPELVRYTARDGVELSGWLYVPENPAPQRPVYVHLHGGPEGQSRPSNHDVLTTLVEAGVTVFTPNIRGSKGNGRSFLHADDRYGRFAAVDDVADTVSFLLDANLASSASIVVGGRSYGGFLAALAAARYPQLCVGFVDACGMTSFETYFESTEPWLASAASPKYGYPMHDAELLMEISPLYKAAEFQAEALLIHGDNDTNVPLQESLQFRDALEAAGHTPELLVVPGEGHQFVKPASRALIADAMVAFLTRLGCLGSRPGGE